MEFMLTPFKNEKQCPKGFVLPVTVIANPILTDTHGQKRVAIIFVVGKATGD